MATIPGTAGNWYSIQEAVSSTSESASQSKSSESNSILGKDAFLQLLITQLANQDPTNPMEDRDFIAQMAQFSSLEQMNNVAAELRGLRQMFSLSSGLIGKTVHWSGSDGILTGIVDSIVLREGETLIQVGDHEIPFERIIRVSESQIDDGPPEEDDEATGEPGGEEAP